MKLCFSLTFSNIFGAALIVLLTWTSLVQAAAIHRDTSPAIRGLGEGSRASGVEVSNDGILRRDDIDFATKPEEETLTGRDSDGVGGFSDDWYTLAVRATEDNNEETDVADHGQLPRRWYTLVEIEEDQESE